MSDDLDLRELFATIDRQYGRLLLGAHRRPRGLWLGQKQLKLLGAHEGATFKPRDRDENLVVHEHPDPDHVEVTS